VGGAGAGVEVVGLL
jgi:hypothetical protein